MKSSVEADFLQSFIESLDAVEQDANGMGRLHSAQIIAEEDGVYVIANYVDSKWHVTIAEELPA